MRLRPPVLSLKVRVNVIDHVMAEPGPLDDPGNAQGIPIRRVPVIRIFGDTSIGHKACLHVHQVWPYFYVEYTGPLNPESGRSSISVLRVAILTGSSQQIYLKTASGSECRNRHVYEPRPP
jgi:hypothetical protein